MLGSIGILNLNTAKLYSTIYIFSINVTLSYIHVPYEVNWIFRTQMDATFTVEIGLVLSK